MTDDLIAKVQNEVAHEQKHRDGIPQIAAGLYLLVAALFMLADKTSFVAIYVVFIPMLVEHLRKRFTYPRIGYAKLHERNSRRSGMMILVLAFLIAGAIAFAVVQNVDIAPQVWKKLNTAGMIIIAVIVLALALFRYLKDRNKTVLFYGGFIILMLAVVMTFKLHIATMSWIILGFGILNLIYGIITLRKFMKKYPVLKDAE